MEFAISCEVRKRLITCEGNSFLGIIQHMLESDTIFFR